LKKEKLYFKSGDLNLYGEIFHPDCANNNLPVLCFCHGIPAVAYNPAEQGYAALAEYFCMNGFTAFTFNFRGAGLSQGNFDIFGWTDDLTAAINYLKTRDEITSTKLITIGFSGGAAVSIYVAAKDKRISSLAALACPATFDFLIGENTEQIIKHFRNIGVIKDDAFPRSVDKWLESFSLISPINFIDKISPRSLLLVHGDEDDTVPPEHARRLFDKARQPKKLDIISGVGHRLRLSNKANETVLNWLKGNTIIDPCV
jgi:fermentation-respiration switch protein FrsA (DUF1100 family)